MNNFFNTWLYLHSSFIQADAAILGLSAIFIIYRLQDLESVYQSAISACKYSTNGSIQDAVRRIVIAKTTTEKVKVLHSNDVLGTQYADQLINIVLIPQYKSGVKKMLSYSQYIITVHLSISALLLLQTPSIFEKFPEWAINGIGIFSTVSFIGVVVVVAIVAKYAIYKEMGFEKQG